MQINNYQKGFVSLLAMVVLVGVVGGGILLSSAAIKNVADKECGGHISAWQSGEIYGDIADNKDGAIEKAQECQEAVNKATKVAKANAALLGRASNIGSNGAEVIATEFINITMDYVENASTSDYVPLEKNNKLPEDIKLEEKPDIIEKVDNFIQEEFAEKTEEREAITPKDEDTSKTDTSIDNIEESAPKEEPREEVKETEKPKDVTVSDCKIGIPDGPAPRVLAVCDNENMGFWYADKDGDIKNISVRFRFSYPEFDGRQEFDWQTAKFETSGNKFCDFQPAIKFGHPSIPAGYKAIIDVDIILEDSKGNKSNISSCTI